ncbi:CoA transferase [Delftia lacustris]|uniref:CoA transferase n=1 Tax=Delftia lacustris TaxID=558537 RepID=UPI0022B608E1|nr:CoA transferase [Delftia lacustris]
MVDFTHFIAGPLATMILADMGADVIKVEPPAAATRCATTRRRCPACSHKVAHLSGATATSAAWRST